MFPEEDLKMPRTSVVKDNKQAGPEISMLLVTGVDPGCSGHTSPRMRPENKSVGQYRRGKGRPGDLPSQELDTSQSFLSH